jgi:hypothetical protein
MPPHAPDSQALFQVLEQTLAVSRRAEQLRLRSPQRVVGTAVDSVLRTEMGSLEPQEEDAPKRVLWYKPMSWLGVIRPHRRDESWPASLCQTLFALTEGAEIAAIPSTCGCKKLSLVPSVTMSARVLHCTLGCQEGTRLGS